MPIYEYRCEQGHTIEVLQRISDDPLVVCEVCEAPVQRVFHPVAVHFKGSGFYNTDYGTRKRQKELKEGGEGGASSDGKGSSENGASSSSSTEGTGSSDSAPAKQADAPAPAAKKKEAKAA